MATFIRLKQIESGSALQQSAASGADFSGSVNAIVSQSLETTLSQSIVNIIVNNVQSALPDGIISSSAQIDITQTTNFVEFSSSISNSIGDIKIELASITGSLETGLSASVATSFSQSNARITQLELFSSSLDNGFATDAELTTTSSLIVDQGEW
jgi:hypothetical protein